MSLVKSYFAIDKDRRDDEKDHLIKQHASKVSSAVSAMTTNNFCVPLESQPYIVRATESHLSRQLSHKLGSSYSIMYGPSSIGKSTLLQYVLKSIIKDRPVLYINLRTRGSFDALMKALNLSPTTKTMHEVLTVLEGVTYKSKVRPLLVLLEDVGIDSHKNPSFLSTLLELQIAEHADIVHVISDYSFIGDILSCKDI